MTVPWIINPRTAAGNMSLGKSTRDDRYWVKASPPFAGCFAKWATSKGLDRVGAG
jgi:hypothetical protein